jgi:hypothetical protein
MKHWVIMVRGLAVVALSACGGASDDNGKPAMKASVSAPTAPSTMLGAAGSTGTVEHNGAAGTSMPATNLGGSGGAGASSMAKPPAIGTGGAGGTTMMTAPPALVTVDPADVAACDPVGAPPSDDEEVEVLQIRTNDPMVVANGFTAPNGTTYACFWLDIDMPEKHHIIGWEGAVGGDRAVHHQQVSLSAKPIYLGAQGGLCGLPSVDFTWTGEKPTEWTPKLAGYPIGGPENGGKAHFLWQVHFESPTTYTGGFNAYITKNLRKYDAGNFEQGDVAGISIPAMATAHHVADCTPDMTTKKLPYPIYIFAAMQHAHLTVTHIKSEALRDNMVIKSFGDQEVSGFLGFFDQQFKPVTPCLEVRGGDQLTTTCDYKNNGPVEITGGEGLNQEMCTTFFQYFPRLPAPANNFCGTIDSSGGFTM